jgi:hopene-associated glycosyltransferase HpnB
VYLLACHGGFWRTDQRLPPGRDPAAWPSVTVVVPARDEAAVLPATLPSLLAQDYRGELRVILVDDNSADGTAQVAEKLAAASGQPFQDWIRLVPAGQRPGGWAGKVWAMQCGLAAAGQPEYVLFTDADISYSPGTLTALVRAADGGGYGLVSQMALLRTETAWERLIVPAFVYFFAQLYPFRRVNRPRARTAAAAGGCMLVRREALAAAGGLAMIRGARIDDVALGRVSARRGALLAGPDHGRSARWPPRPGCGTWWPQRVHPAALLPLLLVTRLALAHTCSPAAASRAWRRRGGRPAAWPRPPRAWPAGCS